MLACRVLDINELNEKRGGVNTIVFQIFYALLCNKFGF